MYWYCTHTAGGSDASLIGDWLKMIPQQVAITTRDPLGAAVLLRSDWIS